MEKKKLNDKYNPQDFEEKLYQEWEEKGYFKPSMDKTKESYCIMMPPPNVTGKLHMGHALDDTIQDVLIRFKRMQGYNTLWLPGSDHAAIATEVKVVEKMKKEEGLTKADIRKIYKNKNLNEISVIDITLNTFYEKSDITIKNIFSDIKKKLDGNREKENVETVLNALEYRFRYLIEYILPKAKWYSYIKICNAAEIKKVKVDFGDSNDSENHNEIINTNAFSLDMIPAYHPFCDCKLKLEKNEV